MPELPEVQTIVSDLEKFLPELKILDVWTDHEKMIKYPKSFNGFKKEIVGRKILKVARKGKNILIHLSGNKTLLIHQKMTGHLMYGEWTAPVLPARRGGHGWQAVKQGPLRDDPQNRFIHIVFILSNRKQLALSDMRKFAKVLVWPTDKLKELKDIKDVGIDALDKNFTLKKFSQIIKNKKGKIKTVLMDQSLVAGIGNIYSDEILWQAGAHPLKEVQKLKTSEIEKIHKAIKPVLKQAIRARGSSNVDYRDALGRKGKYQEMQNAYKQEGKKCEKKDSGVIKRIKIGGRSARFCPVHQVL